MNEFFSSILVFAILLYTRLLGRGIISTPPPRNRNYQAAVSFTANPSLQRVRQSNQAQARPILTKTSRETLTKWTKIFYETSATIQSFKDLRKNFQNELTPETREIYALFLEYVKEIPYSKETILEKHHIIPRHASGTYVKENLVYLSVDDHNLAHFFRYLEFGQKGDLSAVLLRKNQEQNSSLRGKLAAEVNRKNKTGMFDSEWQRQQGLKGGRKGGTANTQKQFEARQKVGQTYGSTVGKSRQSSKLKEFLQKELVWEFQGQQITTPPCESFTEIVGELNSVRGSCIKNSTSFIKVLYSERKQMYGWKFIGKK